MIYAGKQTSGPCQTRVRRERGVELTVWVHEGINCFHFPICPTPNVIVKENLQVRMRKDLCSPDTRRT